MSKKNPFNAAAPLSTGSGSATIYRLDVLEKQGLANLDKLPFSIRILLENLLRNCRRLPGDRGGREGAGRLEARQAAHPRDPVHPGPRRPAGLHRRAGRGRPRRHAQRRRQAGRQSGADQPAGARRPGDRPLRPGRRFRRRVALTSSTSTWSSSATRSATSS